MATIDNRFPTEGTQIDIEARLAAIETALASLMADTTGQNIASAISGLGATLGSDKANIDGSNIVNTSVFKSAIGLNGLETWSVNNGTFSNLVKNNHAYIIIANRLNASEGCILLANMNSNVIKVTEIFKSSTFTYTSDNSTGTITIKRSDSTSSVYARAFLIY